MVTFPALNQSIILRTREHFVTTTQCCFSKPGTMGWERRSALLYQTTCSLHLKFLNTILFPKSLKVKLGREQQHETLAIIIQELLNCALILFHMTVFCSRPSLNFDDKDSQQGDEKKLIPACDHQPSTSGIYGCSSHRFQVFPT